MCCGELDQVGERRDDVERSGSGRWAKRFLTPLSFDTFKVSGRNCVCRLLKFAALRTVKDIVYDSG